QAEDGIRDKLVTGVQTCALPISPADQDRFVREARNAAQLAHPGIVPVYEVGRGGPVPYLVSAYVEGVTLATILTSRRLGFREARSEERRVGKGGGSRWCASRDEG